MTIHRTRKITAAAGLVALLLLTAACGAKSTSGEGISSMKATLAELQKSIEAGDAAKVKEEAHELHETWEKFEDEIKDKSKEVYVQIEDPLGKIESGSEQDSLDKEVLTQETKHLEDALTAAEALK